MDKEKYMQDILQVIEKGVYKDTWESLATHPIPTWYEEAKLGIFIHWGLYSIPAYMTEWYPRFMYYKQNLVYRHHYKKYGKDFEYHDFIPMFTADKFNPSQWLDMFAACNADFVMPVAEHHDGFKMYRSEVNRWNAAEMGPKRDILGEIRKECIDRDIRFTASSHRAENFWFLNGGKTLDRPNATQNEEYRDFYGPCVNLDEKNSAISMSKGANDIVPTKEWLDDWLISSCEVVDRYQPATFYFDFWTSQEKFRPYMRKFLAYFYNRASEWGKDVVSFYKEDAALYPCGVHVQERGQMEGMSVKKWQCETSTSYNAWSYCTTNKFKKVEEIIRNMIDVWSKNGCMALNVGPKGDGSICKEETDILTTLASWVQKNKEGIWGTQPYKVYGEGRVQKAGSFNERYKYKKGDYRFTYKLGALYVFALMPKKQKNFRIKQISRGGACISIVKNVSILGDGQKVSFTKHGGYLEIELDAPIQSEIPICFKVEIA